MRFFPILYASINSIYLHNQIKKTMARKFNRRSFIWYTSATLATSFLLKACADSPSTVILTENSGNDSTDAGNSSETFKIAIALPGVITDGGWNQSGYEGAKKSSRKTQW